MRTQRSADIAAGVFLVALGLVVLIAALDIQSFFGEVLPPRTLPFTLAISTMLGGLLLSIRAYLYRGPEVTGGLAGYERLDEPAGLILQPSGLSLTH